MSAPWTGPVRSSLRWIASPSMTTSPASLRCFASNPTAGTATPPRTPEPVIRGAGASGTAAGSITIGAAFAWAAEAPSATRTARGSTIRAGGGATGVVPAGGAETGTPVAVRPSVRSPGLRPARAHDGQRSVAAARADRRQRPSPGDPSAPPKPVGRPSRAIACPLASASRPAASIATRAARANSAGPSHCSPTQPVERSPSRNGALPGHEPVERQRRLDPGDLGLVEGASKPRDRRGPVAGVDHDLGDEVVVLGRDPVAGLDAGVDPDARTGRHDPATDPAGCRRELARRVLRRDPDLDRVAGRLGGPSGRGERLGRQRPPGGQPELLPDDVETGHQLGHPVLDLEPGVDLEEVERAVRRAEELGGRGVLQAGRGRDPDRHRVQLPALGRRSDPGAGASSTSFWWRRWIEQSRSPIATTWPVASPSSWTSMWRAGTISRSR